MVSTFMALCHLTISTRGFTGMTSTDPNTLSGKQQWWFAEQIMHHLTWKTNNKEWSELQQSYKSIFIFICTAEGCAVTGYYVHSAHPETR